MPMMPRKPEFVVVARYSRDNFDRVRQLAPDGGGLQATFDEWKEQAEKQIAEIVATIGVKVHWIDVDPDDLAAFLRRNNVESNPETRAWYVHQLHASRITGKH